jgi:hypothetical protein
MKSECTASLFTSLTHTASWRLALDGQYPDHRNARAAKKLSKLAGEAANLSDDSWELLRPHFNSERWNDCLRQANRQVGFLHRKVSLTFFKRRIAPRYRHWTHPRQYPITERCRAMESPIVPWRRWQKRLARKFVVRRQVDLQ